MEQADFNRYMDEYFQNKFNQLSYSNQRYPKRMEKITLDLSVAPTQPVKISVPFKSCLVSRIYSTSVTTTDKAGSVKILFDYDNLMNIQNAVTLFVNDSFVMDTSVATGYLTWTAQADTTIDIYFFVDLDYRAGTTKTQIVGTVSVQNSTSTPLYAKSLVPVVTAVSLSNTTNASVRTIAAGLYAWVTIQCSSGGPVGCSATVNGTKVIDASSFASTQVTSSIRICVPTGTVFGMTSNNAGAIVSFLFEEYTVY